jgi:VIT1/CCC1 family predicted Fe2+/Mn2+ transporter
MGGIINMKLSLRKGFSFGLTSAIITTLGLIVGLYAGTHSRIAVIGGILIIAIADAMSDSLGIHISEEAENKHTGKEVWESTLSAFCSKFIFAITFLVPVLLFELQTAILVSVAWGMLLLSVLSFSIAKTSRTNAARVITEHLVIAVAVIVITFYMGAFVASVFV